MPTPAGTSSPRPRRGDLSRYEEPAGDPGLFGPTSVTWGVHAAPSMAVGGIAAVVLQVLHPKVAAGVADHSAYRTDPMGRLQRTAEFVNGTTYGGTELAERYLRTLRTVHRRVLGSTPAGDPYDANDPVLVTWVHATEVYGFLRARQRLVLPPLSARDADRYVEEMAVIGTGLGGVDVPTTTAELRRTVDGMRGTLAAEEQCQEILRFVLHPAAGTPAPIALAQRVVVEAGLSLLPGWAQDLLGRRRLELADRATLAPVAALACELLGRATGPSPFLAAARRRCAASAEAPAA